MNDINNLYKDMERSSFDYLIIDGYRYSIKKVLKYLKSIKNGRYNDNNKMEFYKKDGIDKTKRALNSTEKKSDSIKKIITYMNRLNNILFTPISSSKEKNTRGRIKTDEARSFEDQKGSGYVNLLIILSKAYTNNSSKELISDIKQLINNLHENKQITKQVYNNLIKSITYENDS